MFDGHQGAIYSLDFSADGHLLASGSDDDTVRIWGINDGSAKVLRHDNHNNEGRAGISSVAISPDSQYVAAGSWDSMVHIWDVRTGQSIKTLRGHQDGVYSIVFTPDGKSLLSGSRDKTLKLWDISALGSGMGVIAQMGTKEDEGNACTLNFTGHGVRDSTLNMMNPG